MGLAISQRADVRYGGCCCRDRDAHVDVRATQRQSHGGQDAPLLDEPNVTLRASWHVVRQFVAAPCALVC
jgi:hypothetical protein